MCRSLGYPGRPASRPTVSAPGRRSVDLAGPLRQRKPARGASGPTTRPHQRRTPRPSSPPDNGTSSEHPLTDSRRRPLTCVPTGSRSRYALSHCDRDAQEGCRDGGGILARACVLAVEEGFELAMQLGLAAVGCCSRVRVHGRPVIRPELSKQLRGCAWEVERVGIPLERDAFQHSRARIARSRCPRRPTSWADETFGWRRGVGGTDLRIWATSASRWGSSSP